MAEEKESISITKLSALSDAFMWSETDILWVPMFFCSDSKASLHPYGEEEGYDNKSCEYQIHEHTKIQIK